MSIVKGTEQIAQFATGLLVMGCLTTSGLAEGYSRLKRDPQAATGIQQWRNRAAMRAVTTPLIMWLVIRVAGFYNIPVVSCIELVPFL